MDTVMAASWAGPFNRQYSGLDLWGSLSFSPYDTLDGEYDKQSGKDLRKLFPEKPRLAGTFLTMTMCLFWIIMPGLLFSGNMENILV